MSACVYTLSDPRTHFVRYVGFTKNLPRRTYDHYRDSDGSKKSNWVQSLRRMGMRPIAEVLEGLNSPSEAEASECERFWIESLRQMGANLTNSKLATAVCFNMSPEVKKRISEKHRGKVISPEARLKMSIAAKRRTPEIRANMAAAQKGKRASLETRQKLSMIHRGKKMSPGSIIKGALARTGLKRTSEFCAAMSALKKGFKHSQETRRKMALARIGKPRPSYIGIKISASKMGHAVSPETRKKLSDAINRKWLEGHYKERNLCH